MAEVKIVLVEPERQINLGAVCRAMANFGFPELRIVKPKCRLGFEAKKFAKHGLDVLQNARIFDSLTGAASDCDFLAGTTGITWRHKKTIRNPMGLKDFAAKLKKEAKGKKVALIFGREGIGLGRREIEECDFLVKIEASPRYPVLNLSHAVAICLYELSASDLGGDSAGAAYSLPTKEEKEQLLKSFNLLVDFYKPILRNPEKVKVAFRRVVGRSLLSQVEAVSILGILRRAHRDLCAKR